MRLTVIRHEIVVGWFITVALVLGVAVMLVRVRAPSTFIAPYVVRFTVPHGKGLQLAAPVLLQGIRIGEVDRIELTPENQVEVTCRIYADYAGHLRADAVANLLSPPLLGDTKVELQAGAAPTLARSGQAIGTRTVPSLMDRIGGLEGDVTGVIAHVDSLVVTATAAVDELRQVAGRIEAGEGLAGRLIRDEALADDAQETLAHVNGAAARLEGEVLDKATAAIDSAHGLIADLQSEDGQLMTLLGDVDQTVVDARQALNDAKLAETVAGLRSVAAALKDASDSIGPMTDDTRQAMRALGEASRALQVLSEELTRQPNSVIFGRTPAPGPGIGR